MSDWMTVKDGIRIGAAAALLACVGMVGCEGETGNGDDSTTADDVKQSATETLEKAGDYANEQFAAFKKKMDDSLDSLNTDIQTLETRAGELSGDAKAQLETRIDEIKAQRDEFVDWLDGLGDSTGDAWEDVKSGTEDAWDSLSQSVKDAMAEYGSGDGS